MSTEDDDQDEYRLALIKDRAEKVKAASLQKQGAIPVEPRNEDGASACILDGCTKLAKYRGLCWTHYTQHSKAGDIDKFGLPKSKGGRRKATFVEPALKQKPIKRPRASMLGRVTAATITLSPEPPKEAEISLTVRSEADDLAAVVEALLDLGRARRNVCAASGLAGIPWETTKRLIEKVSREEES